MRIRFERISKRFGSAVALEKLTLEAREGELLVLLGPSGCGKSTSLRLVAGLTDLSEGDIYIGERCVNSLPPQARDVAMVFQNYALYPHMTVAENIGYPLRVRHKSREEITQEVGRVAAMLGIQGLLDRRPRQLSGGQQQRVALARAIVRHPVAFLMDEPLSNLDANLRLQMRAELKRLQAELGTTMLYVTHDHAEAMTLAHRLAVLREGRLQQVGPPMELYRHPAHKFVAGFLGTPPMNFLPGTLDNGVFRFSAGVIPLDAKQAQAAGVGNVILGFRAQEAVLTSPESPGAVRGQVYVTEEMGHETLVVLSCGEHKITVAARAGFRAEVGQVCGVVVPARALHLFDTTTGAALLAGDASSEES